jgi:hypothetical protein
LIKEDEKIMEKNSSTVTAKLDDKEEMEKLLEIVKDMENTRLDDNHELKCELDLTKETPTVNFSVEKKDGILDSEVNINNVVSQFQYLQNHMTLKFKMNAQDIFYNLIDTIDSTNDLKKLYKDGYKKIYIKVGQNEYYKYDQEMSDPNCLQYCDDDTCKILLKRELPKYQVPPEFTLEPDGLKISIGDIEVKRSYIDWLSYTPDQIKEKYGSKFSGIFQRILNFANIGLMIQDECKETGFYIILEHGNKLKVVIDDIAVKLNPEEWGTLSLNECKNRYGSKFADKFDIIKSRLYYSRFGKVS